MTDDADLTVRARAASVVVQDGVRLIGFAEGDEDEPYALFSQATAGGPVWFEVNDEMFGAEDAVASLAVSDSALRVTVDPTLAHVFGFARTVSIRVDPQTEGLTQALTALRRMLGTRMVNAVPD